MKAICEMTTEELCFEYVNCVVWSEVDLMPDAQRKYWRDRAQCIIEYLESERV